MTTTHTTFGQALRAARLDAGQTQAQLAQALGLSAAYISDIEHQRRNPLSREDILKAAATLSCDPGELLKAAALDRGEVTLPLGPTDAHRDLALSLAARWETAVAEARLVGLTLRRMPMGGWDNERGDKGELCHVRAVVDDRLIIRWWRPTKQRWEYAAEPRPILRYMYDQLYRADSELLRAWILGDATAPEWCGRER